MAVHPESDPIDQEIERVLDENPRLLEELQTFDRRFAAGEVRDDEFVSTDEVRGRLGIAPLDVECAGNEDEDVSLRDEAH